MAPPTFPYPNLKAYPAQSGLSFNFAEYHGNGVVGTFDSHLGPDGVSASMVLLIYWQDLETALYQILGYSWRDTAGQKTPDGHYFLRRLTPWQHPFYNQLYAKSVTKIQGLRLEGNNVTNPTTVFSLQGGGIGAGALPNKGPYTVYHFALLTIQFSRPHYAVRTDADVLDQVSGNPREWLRYVDRRWAANAEMLCREGTTWSYSPGQTFVGGSQTYFNAPMGQVIAKTRITRRWYEVPEACLFDPASSDASPSGLPTNLLYTQTAITNPISLTTVGGGYSYPRGSPICGCVNAPVGGLTLLTTGNVALTSPVITALPTTAGLAPGFFVDAGGAYTTIKSVDSDHQVTLNAPCQATATGIYVLFEDPAKCFLGFRAGTLLLESFEVVPRPLHLPPGLMQVPSFGNNEAVSQVQYDVVFSFVHFDPPRSPLGSVFRGWNLVPYSADGLFYSLCGRTAVSGVTSPTTPYQYADFSDLFKTL